MMPAQQDGWLTFFRRNSQARLRLFCFPYAGGVAPAFRSWASDLPSAIEVCGIQYPGRGMRAQEQSFHSLGPLLEALLNAIIPFLDKPFIFFGHSMGALISFELARVLRLRNCPGPEHVFLSAAGAPHIPEPHSIHHLPNVEFLHEIVKLNGIPADILCRADLVNYMLPILRADFAVLESYSYHSGPPLECPITVFGGDRDPRVDKRRLEAWNQHTSMYFSAVMFSGDHFFLRTAQHALLKAIVEELQPLLNVNSFA